MSGSREESPDWLRGFQAPTLSTMISLDSDSSPNNSPLREVEIDQKRSLFHETSYFSEENKDKHTTLNDSKTADGPPKKRSKGKSPKKQITMEDLVPKKKKKQDNHKKNEGNACDGNEVEEAILQNQNQPDAPNHTVWALSSDSEADPDISPIKNDEIHLEGLSTHGASKLLEKGKDEDVVSTDSKKGSKRKSPKKQTKKDDNVPKQKKKLNSSTKTTGEVAEEASEKQIELQVSSSSFPLVLSEKVHRSKALVECEGNSIDLSGDIGSIGRVVISDSPSRKQEMLLDLKGTIYKTTIVPSRTFCVVSFGQTEAKIEAIMNDFIQLKPQSNVYDAETIVEGTLEGFSFESDDEADKMPKSTHQTDQNNGTEEQSKGKTKGKAAKTGVLRRKGKAVGGKPVKKVRKKSQVPKKGTARK